MSFRTKNAVVVLAGLLLTIVAGYAFSSQQAREALRTVASAVWGS